MCFGSLDRGPPTVGVSPTSRVARCALALAALLGVLAALPAASHADACTPPVASQVACENTKPGIARSEWQVGDGDPTIQGFATKMSVNKGQPISFKIKSATTNYRIDILRLGYYGGDGARMIAENLTPTSTANQPDCIKQASSGLIDCGNWSVSRTWTMPSTAITGVYIARLVRNDTDGASIIPFVVRDDAADADVVLQTSDANWAAYNVYGGNNLYQCTVACPPGTPRAYKGANKVSYNKPFTTAGIEGPILFYSEYPMIRFMEASGYDMSYISSVDVHQQPSLLLDHKVFISSGHDEYWSNTQRNHVEAARDAGVSLAFFGGNDIFWKTRWEPSIDDSNTPDRTLVSYKDTHYDAPTDPVEWTGTWRDPRFSPPGDGGRPENALMGQMFIVNGGTADMEVPVQYKQLRAWRNTDVANLTSGKVTLAPTSLGYEWDADYDNEFRPPGTFRLSSTTVHANDVFLDYGTTTAPLTETHNMTMYRAASGARVFSAGSINWSRGLDNWAETTLPTNRNMQQMTVNVFADMGAQGHTLLPGIVAASPSTDATTPSSTITNPSGGTFVDGTNITISGTAVDTGGGVVAGVEVSTDGGATWHLASGTTNWHYTWSVHGTPSTTLRSRAVDDSGNLEAPKPGVTIAVPCPCSIFGGTTPPAVDAGDPSAVELGVKFKTDTFGTVSGIRFYKSAANTGVHIGSLWSASGQRLAQATFSSETPTGWQKVMFSNPVAILPNTTYTASYYAPQGHYAATIHVMYPSPLPAPVVAGAINNPPLHALPDTASAPNGVFAYSSASTFPTSSFLASNYWVDVLFTPSPPPGPLAGATATADYGSAQVSWTAPSSGGPVTTYTITPYVGVSAQTPTTVNGSPPGTSATVRGLTPGTTYTFRVQASNPNGAGPPTAPSGPVVPYALIPPTPPTSVSGEAASPTTINVSWMAPVSDGGSDITGYTVTPYIGSTAQPPSSAGPSATGTTVTGLQTGTQYTFRVTATNAIGTSVPSAASAAVAPYSMLLDLGTPGTPDSGDSNSVELGVKFRADVPGNVHGVRFYKSAANTGTHVGSLWTVGGQRLAQATFTSESSSGWQTVTFATPVLVEANTTYIASYFAPNGRYAYAANVFASGGIDNAMLHAPSSPSAGGNGVYAYGGASAFPSASYNATSYWVDVNFVKLLVPGQVTGVSATAGKTSASVSWSAPASGGTPASYSITPYIGAAAQAATTVSGTPAPTTATVRHLTAGTAYTFRVKAINLAGPGALSAPSSPVTPTAPTLATAPTDVAAVGKTDSALVSWTPPSDDGGQDVTGYVITPYDGSTAQTPGNAGASATSATVGGLANGTTYTFTVAAITSVGTGAPSAASPATTPYAMIFDLAAPATPAAADTNAVELGVKFRSSVQGSIHGIRFYKASPDAGTHEGSLWTASGQRLAQVTFTSESGSGWQTGRFAFPVQIDANTTYVASYHAPNGAYAVTPNAFLPGAIVNGRLQALGDAGTGNGVFAYNAASTFPALSYNASNYWVDVLFVALPLPGQVTGVTATAEHGSARVTWTAPSSGGAVTAYTITPYVGSTAKTPVTVAGSPPATSKTVSGLVPGTAYTFRVAASNANGSGPDSAASSSVIPLATTAPEAPTDVSAVPAALAASVSWSEPDGDGGQPITGYTITPYNGATALPSTTAGAAARSATIGGLWSGTTYTFKVAASNSVGTGPESAASAPATTPAATIFGLNTPSSVDAGDPASVELGVKFRSDVDGKVNGIRFYKAAANTGPRVASLWSASGQLLGTATSGSETASGWQTVDFATPVAISANTTYVASYFAPNGHYSATGGGFASGVDNGPLHALPNATSANGLYDYTGSSAFPTSTFNSTNYWVDVLFAGPGS